MTTALERLLSGYYNSNPYNPSSNPGGFAADGHVLNFPAALQDIGQVGTDTAALISATQALLNASVPNLTAGNVDFAGLSGMMHAWDFARGVQRRNYANIIDLASDPAMTFARASAAVQQTSAGVFSEVTSGTKRITDLGYLAEPALSNLIRNPRAEGGGAGINPTNWTITNGPANGITITKVGRQTVQGVDCMIVDLVGTAIATDAILNVVYDDTYVAPTSAGETLQYSACVAMLAGSLNGLERVRHRAYVAGGTDLSGASFLANISTTLKQHSTAITTSTGGTNVRPHTQVTALAGQVINVRLAFGWPSLTRSLFPTSPILPAAGSLVSSSRAMDALYFDNLNMAFTEGTIVANVVPTSSAGVVQNIFSAEAGASNNERVNAYIDASGVLMAEVATGGSVTGALTTGSYAPPDRARLKVAVSWKAGEFRLYANGAQRAVDLSGAVPVGLSRMHVANRGTGGAALNGWTERLGYYPRALTQAELAAVTT